MKIRRHSRVWLAVLTTTATTTQQQVLILVFKDGPGMYEYKRKKRKGKLHRHAHLHSANVPTRNTLLVVSGINVLPKTLSLAAPVGKAHPTTTLSVAYPPMFMSPPKKEEDVPKKTPTNQPPFNR
jgi:hypothetical protein